MKIAFHRLLLVLLLLLATVPVYALQGDLDLGFSSDGKLDAVVGNGNEYGRKVGIQSLAGVDYLIIAGHAYNDTLKNHDMIVRRYLPNGSLDTLFGTAGVQTIDFGNGDDYLTDLYIYPDGRLLLAGYTNSTGGGDFAVALLTPSGLLSTSFGLMGKKTIDISGLDDKAYAVNVMTTAGSDKILVAGSAMIDHGTVQVPDLDLDFAVVRLNLDGNLDSTFNSTGIATKDITTAGETAYGVGVQSSGKIIVAGVDSTFPSEIRLI
ncbi:MAG: hypothetical protein IBX47_06915, partial [Desulfuromonadales bacterium]|nr:hypothetical protein [Desulfuromonadales bacterium]